MEQLILHLLGDYVTQSQWMADNKRKNDIAAFVHAVVYMLPFLWLAPSLASLSAIGISHFLIDRFGLAVYVVWAKNVLLRPQAWRMTAWVDEFMLALDLLVGDERHSAMERQRERERYAFRNCKATGYPSDLPPWLSVWLLIAADNTLHLICNYLALKFL